MRIIWIRWLSRWDSTISSTGTCIIQFGSTGTSDGQFNTPHDVALDSSGNIYVADTGNHRVQVFTPTSGHGGSGGSGGAGGVGGNGGAGGSGGSVGSKSGMDNESYRNILPLSHY